MSDKIPVIAVFDIGKTNKKILLLDEQYKIVYEKSTQLVEMIDEDGDPCEDVLLLEKWVNDLLLIVGSLNEFDVRALNVSAYGASFIHLDENGKSLTPLYNYLKPYPDELKNMFYQTYGGEVAFSLQTASPVLGSLNSGMQLYRLKIQSPGLFKKIKNSLHLPQYLTWLISRTPSADITSIGCHTGLWDFGKNRYHDWVLEEGIAPKLCPLFPCDHVLPAKFNNRQIVAGVGLHDSSAALIPYIGHFHEPFILLSTGTWSISLNPFNRDPLTAEELKMDCLCYLDYKGNPVKASRLFAGNEHEIQTKRLSEHFHMRQDRYKVVDFHPGLYGKLQRPSEGNQLNVDLLKAGFSMRDLSSYKTYEEAYHQLICDLVSQQVISTQLVISKHGKVNRIFVDGGFSNNDVFMNVLAAAFPDKEVFAASVPQASAIGAALAIHSHWNKQPPPKDIIQLTRIRIKGFTGLTEY